MPGSDVTVRPGRPSVHSVMTTVLDGDFRVDAPPVELAARRRAIVDGPWTWLRQVHGAEVVVVDSPGQHAGAAADAAVTTVPGPVLAVQSADCAPVLFTGLGLSPTGAPVTAVGVAHAGWRGLEAGVLQRTVATLRDLGADDVSWRVGPCISAAHYEFSAAELDRLVSRFGPTVRGRTRWGTEALDLRAAVRCALTEVGATEQAGTGEPPCTAADTRYHSFRARGDVGRQATVTWMTPPDPAPDATPEGPR